MKYCKKCLQPDTRPGVYFDENQVCGACLYEEQKALINWEMRGKELRNIAEQAKMRAKSNGIPYDCVIGVSGGKDSTYQAIYAKEKLGLNCLLVNCAPDEITDTGRKNLDNLASFGFDIFQIRPDPVIAKELARISFFDYGNMVKASEYCLWVSAFRIAVQWSIPLIIQGENPALTLGVSNGMNTNGDALGVFDSNTLKGGNVDIWVSDTVPREKLYLYQPPKKDDFLEKDIKAIYLQYYLKEWSQVGNADFAVARGLLGRAFEDLHDIGRYRRYTALDSDMAIPNQMLKYLKFGFGFATDEACYDIREGRLTRKDAIWLVKEYDGKCSEEYIEQACNYLNITKEDFWSVADRYVNTDLFEKKLSSMRWEPKFSVGEDFDF